MSLLREYIRELLVEINMKSSTLQQAIALLDKHGEHTWVFFDTETTGLDPNVGQITEIAAIAINPNGWEGEPTEVGKYHTKIDLTPESLELYNNPDSPARQKWEKDNAKSRRPMDEPQDILRMTRYGEKNADYIDEQDALQEFADFVNDIDNPLLVAQNARFDMRFVNHRSGGKITGVPVLDTLELMRTQMVPLLKTLESSGDADAQAFLEKLEVDYGFGPRISTSMGVVAKALDINIDEWHNALADVKMMMSMTAEVIQMVKAGQEVDVSDEQERIFTNRAKRRRSKKNKGIRRREELEAS